MRKLIMSAAVLALVAPLSISKVQVAEAAVVEGSATCGELPNAKWSWVITTSEPIISGGETTTSTGTVSYNPTGKVGSADVTVTTAPTISTSVVTCTALNPQGKVNTDKSTTAETVVVVAEGGSTTTNQTVCNPGASLPNCPL